MVTTSVDAVLTRLDRLERQHRSLKRLVTLGLVGLAALLLMGQGSPGGVARALQAERFVLRDRSGKIRAELGLLADVVTALSLYDERGTLRVVLAAGPGPGSSVAVFDLPGRVAVASLGVDADGGGSLKLFDKSGKPAPGTRP